MDCQTCLEKIRETDRINEKEYSAEVLEHLQNCPDCQTELAWQKQVRFSFEAQEAVPQDLHLQIMNFIKKETGAIKEEKESFSFNKIWEIILNSIRDKAKVSGVLVMTAFALVLAYQGLNKPKQAEPSFLLSVESAAPEAKMDDSQMMRGSSLSELLQESLLLTPEPISQFPFTLDSEELTGFEEYFILEIDFDENKKLSQKGAQEFSFDKNKNTDLATEDFSTFVGTWYELQDLLPEGEEKDLLTQKLRYFSDKTEKIVFDPDAVYFWVITAVINEP